MKFKPPKLVGTFKERDAAAEKWLVSVIEAKDKEVSARAIKWAEQEGYLSYGGSILLRMSLDHPPRRRGTHISSILAIEEAIFEEHNKRRLLDRLPIGTPGCWEFSRSRKRGAYSVFSGHSKVHSKPFALAAHRAVYRMLRGPIPAEMVLDHICENRLCVNPDHLEVVTQHENARRAKKPRQIPLF